MYKCNTIFAFDMNSFIVGIQVSQHNRSGLYVIYLT